MSGSAATPRGHLQAVGRDARGRKQYRYHANWRAVRDEAKYSKMLMFGESPTRPSATHVQHDLRLPGLPKRKVLAAIVALLEKTMMRVGNEEYAKQNKSYGLTTLRDRHITVKGSHVEFDFRGKHGVDHHIDLQDRKLAKIVQRCRDIPGQDLFQFLDHDGERHGVGSEDVNEYLHEISGQSDYRQGFPHLGRDQPRRRSPRPNSSASTPKAAAKKELVKAVEHVAKKLGNTPAICRKCYIHPAVFEGYLDGSLAEGLKRRADDLLEHPSSGRADGAGSRAHRLPQPASRQRPSRLLLRNELSRRWLDHRAPVKRTLPRSDGE